MNEEREMRLKKKSFRSTKIKTNRYKKIEDKL